MTNNEELLVIEARQEPIGGGWSILGEACPNITNYKKIILDFTCLPDLFRDDTTAAAAYRQLSIMRQGISEIMRVGGQVVVLLPPPDRLDVRFTVNGQTTRLNLPNEIPGALGYTPDRGLRVDTCEETIRNYFVGIDNVNGRIYSSNSNLNEVTLASGVLGQKIAVKVAIDSGAIFYLPPYRGLASEAIDIVARYLLHTPRQGNDWPEWVSSVPFQPVREAFDALEGAKAQLVIAEQRVQKASQLFEENRAPLGILIETGLSLQGKCERLFQEMGIRTSPVRDDVSDEFMLEGGPKPILLEVKGLEGPAKKVHYAQLLADAFGWEELEGRPAVPLLLANAYRNLPVDKRETNGHPAFSEWVESNATMHGVVLMTTWDLLGLYYAAQTNQNVGQELLAYICTSSGGRLDVKQVLLSACTTNPG